MYKKILVPIANDHDPHTAEALTIARLLADEGGSITALTVVEAIPEYIAVQLPEGQIEKTHNSVVSALEDEMKGTEVNVVVVSGHSGRTILDWAGENGVDCIVMASHRPGLSDYFLGSTAARVVRHAQCAVHVLR
ncbi:Nucleotide-binding universal stress protein, UspA family [Shimia gijangensis]|uniref:Nucleotide-binding universal stress protein, UspA family n=1 Tax=Shimia gijangensis TaxID=1470563 RepID=A0A1M6ICN2_9RHOB|nr:universal stress protein [Shimia gijangensis]SHJ32222.1 Nucleotide-binding universal stress protein, UspA family [Shimia gijangensis]